MADELRIDVGDVQVKGDRSVFPVESKVVASYNWSTTSKSGKPCIISPGAPRVFVSPSGRGGFTLSKDSGDSMIDENGTRMSPFSAIEPLLHSLDVCSPGFDMDTVDIVTDRNNLRKLLKFCGSPGERTLSSTPSNVRNEPFKFFVHGIGEGRKDRRTLVFTRVTTGAEEHYPGYGFRFEQKLTEKDPGALPDAGSFRVVVKMNLDGMSLLVRSEVDASEPGPTKKPCTRGARHSDGDLSGKLGSLLVSPGRKSESKMGTSTPSEQRTSSSGGMKESSGKSGLTSTKSGELLDDTAVQLLELKTKNGRHADEINWKDFYWQMALGGAHKLVLGLHNRGTFDNVQQLSIDKVKARADETGSSSMAYLANTLREVVKAAQCLMAAHAPSSRGKDDQGVRAAVVVEHSPSVRCGKGTLLVRLAVPGDGAVAP